MNKTQKKYSRAILQGFSILFLLFLLSMDVILLLVLYHVVLLPLLPQQGAVRIEMYFCTLLNLFIVKHNDSLQMTLIRS